MAQFSRVKSMDKNTLKTIFGFIGTMVSKYTPFDLHKDTLEGVYNYLPIDDRLTTSGQPSEAQFQLIKAAGFNQVINLAPHGAENALADEAKTLAELDISYTHIPVDFSNPTDDDFEQFCQAVAASGEEKLWVHCAANMRVSAFTYRYRRDVLKVPEQEASADLHKIWTPSGVWQRFTA